MSFQIEKCGCVYLHGADYDLDIKELMDICSVHERRKRKERRSRKSWKIWLGVLIFEFGISRRHGPRRWIRTTKTYNIPVDWITTVAQQENGVK